MKYRFEINDLRALLTLLNVVGIIAFGISFCWFGLTVAAAGLVKDFAKDKKVNGVIMHSANAVLNIYFLCM